MAASPSPSSAGYLDMAFPVSGHAGGWQRGVVISLFAGKLAVSGQSGTRVAGRGEK